METESPSVRSRGKKLDANKLSALEKLKKARQGEKIEDDEEDEEELYEYVEEYDDEEEDEFESKKKHSKHSHKENRDDKSNKKNQQQGSSRKNLIKDKLSNFNDDSESTANAGATDIRTAFFRATTATNAKPKSEKKLFESSGAGGGGLNDDDLANEIMQELTARKSSSTNAAKHSTQSRPKPAMHHHTPGRSAMPPHIPFSMVNPSPVNQMSLSPAHKRKLSPSTSNCTKSGSEIHKSKKIELDEELVQQLFDTDSQQEITQIETTASKAPLSTNKNKLNDLSNSTLTNFNSPCTVVKSEPVDHDYSLNPNQANSKSDAAACVKKEPTTDADDQEALENIELLSQLTLEATSSNKSQFNGSIKQESGVESSTLDDADFQIHLRNQANSNRLLFYWLDSYEDPYNSNGTVYIFGKMPIVKQDKTNAEQQALSFASVCCIVKNIPKRIYVLPRKYRRVKSEPGTNDLSKEPVTMEKVTEEIVSILTRLKISSYTTKVVKKNFAFDKKLPNKDEGDEIPYEGEYLQVEYHQESSQNNRAIPADLQGDYFLCIFGAQTSYTEHLLVDLRIKGPCWLLVSNARRRDIESGGGVGSMLSWCKVEYILDNYRNMSLYHENVTLDKPAVPLPQTPPLTILTLIMRTTLNVKSQEHEIVCVCGLISHKFHLEKATMPTTIKGATQPALYDSYFCALSKPTSAVFPYDLQNTLKSIQNKFRVEVCGSERAMLAFLLCKIHSLDVDVIIGHDLFGFNLDILLNRCTVNKVPHWSRLGRLKRNNMPLLPGQNNKKQAHNTTIHNLAVQQRIQTVCSGRLLCDIMISAKELLTKCKSFDLNELVAHILFKKENSSANPNLTRDFDEEKNVLAYYNSSQLILKLLQLAMTDCTYIMRICNDLQCLQLAYQITCIAGNVLSRTLIGGRSERNEFLLLHAFYDKDFILPDKHVSSFAARNAAKNAAAAATAAAKNNPKAAKANVKSEPADSQQPQQSFATTNEEMEDDLLMSKMVLDDEEDENGKKKSSDGAAKAAPASSTHSNGYTGGLVLEPRVGFYDKFILLLDFNSLYPSIIQEFNICFTTISRPASDLIDRDIDEYLENYIKVPSGDEKPGILPLEIRKLVDSRRQVKQLMQDKNLSVDLKMQYDIRQKALKLTANSVYGCLGFENSRFYCKPLAALITKNGRNILMKTKELVESKKIEVIYGDTDSIMINTNLNDYDQVIKLGNMIKAEVNKLYKHLEIDIDGVFKCLLLLRKKKYAALTIVGRNPKDLTLQYQQEIKGLDVVRRDWCLLAKQIGEKVIGEILSGQNCDIVISNINRILTETGEKIKNNAFDLNLFEISKQLNRNPEDYNDANHQSHVIVALRHNSDINNSKKYKSGDVISYIICEDGTQNSATQRAYSKSDLLKNGENLKLDTRYYLTQQIHPVVTRLCEPIEEIDAFHVAKCLGLDPSGFRHKTSGSSTSTVNIAPPQLTKQQKKIENFMNEMDKFNNCLAFKYICPNCKTETSWQSLFTKLSQSAPQVKKEPVEVKSEPKTVTEMDDDEDDIKFDDDLGIVKSVTQKNSNFKCILDACSNRECKLKPLTKLAYIKNLITLQLNKFIKQYYQAWLVCEDPMCSYRTKRISCKFFHGKPQCIECERYSALLEYSHSDLYYQMKFFKFIFDVDAYKNYYKDDANEITNLVRSNKELQSALNQLKEHVNKKIKLNAFGMVDLTQLFKTLF